MGRFVCLFFETICFALSIMGCICEGHSSTIHQLNTNATIRIVILAVGRREWFIPKYLQSTRLFICMVSIMYAKSTTLLIECLLKYEWCLPLPLRLQWTL